MSLSRVCNDLFSAMGKHEFIHRTLTSCYLCSNWLWWKTTGNKLVFLNDAWPLMINNPAKEDGSISNHVSAKKLSRITQRWHSLERRTPVLTTTSDICLSIWMSATHGATHNEEDFFTNDASQSTFDRKGVFLSIDDSMPSINKQC